MSLKGSLSALTLLVGIRATGKEFALWVGFVALLLLGLGGCVTLTQPRSATQRVLVQDTPAVAYQKAVRASLALGGQIPAYDPTQRSVSAKLDQAVTLSIALTPQGTGTVLDVQATAAAGYILTHDVPQDVQAFLAAYHRQS
jgi:hypothetical protein